MDVAVSTRVVARNNIGQFIRDCEQAAGETVLDVAKQGVAASQALAPKRTGALAASIQPFLITRTQAVWGSALKYALPQETGARPHPLPANVSFWWEREGRPWMAPETYLRVTGFPGADPISHPGNPATHYLRDGFDAIKHRITDIMRKHYPG